MPSLFSPLSRRLPVLFVVGSMLATLAARTARADEPPQVPGLAGFGGNSLLLGGGDEKVTVAAKLVGGPVGTGTLQITATVADGFHIYSISQKKGKSGGPDRTEIIIADGKGYKLTGPLVAQDKPKIARMDDIWPGVDIEEHHHTVTWTAPVLFDAGVDPAKAQIEGTAIGQFCDENSCQQFKTKFVAEYVKPTNVLRVGHASVRVTAEASAVAPGQTVPVTVTIKPDEHWHAYQLSHTVPEVTASFPTLVVVKAPLPYRVNKTEAGMPLVTAGDQKYYEGEVTFATQVVVPDTAQPGEKATITGIVGFQVCRTNSGCDVPTGVKFTLTLPVEKAAAPGSTAAALEKADYDTAVAELKANAVAPLDLQLLMTIIGSSLLGGLILNLMPCVLPVIGLKIMSFVQQAHDDRRHVLVLNLWYSAGLLLVFLALATLSVVLNKSWGEQFTSTWFNIALSGLVFAMALSFLGVWEIPIPGFVGSGKSGELAQREGAAGAFAKGVVTTVLATPCSGPFLGFVFGFTLNQPAYIVYLVFTCIGLGMAAPYLLIGVFPELIRALPKPGAWMETFKQAMGLVLLGTVVFLFTFIDKNYLAATFAILVSIWAGCWWIGKVPLTAEFGRKAAGYATGILLATALGGASFAMLRPHEPLLPWQPFTVADVEKAKAEGKTVMIDFTADWCLTCKTNLKVAVDTHKTLEVVKENNIVVFLADWTKPSDEIKRTLNGLGSHSIPVLAIYPAGQPDKPIILRDLLGQQKVIDALKEAGPSKAGPVEPTPPKSAIPTTASTAQN